MKQCIVCVLILLNLSCIIMASESSHPQQISYTPRQIVKFYEEAIKKTLEKDPDYFKRNNQSVAKKTSVTIGDTTTYYAKNFRNSSFYTIKAVLMAQSKNANIWVETTSWDTGFVDMSDIESIIHHFEESTPEESIDSSKGIFEIDTTYFGLPPNVDDDNIVDLLILDIQDDYDETNTYVGGYFYCIDQSPPSEYYGSNFRDIIYLDSYPSLSYGTYLSTVAHELQHLIHYHYDPNEDDWLDEAMSTLAEAYCGFGLREPEMFLASPNNDITSWDEVIDYSEANLMALYMVEQYGSEFIKALTQCPVTSIPSIDTAITQMNIPSSSVELIKNWLICNYVNDTTVSTKWGYRHSDMAGMRATVKKTISQYPANYDGEYIFPVGANYIKFINADTLSLDFDSDYAFAQLIRYYEDGNVDVLDLTAGQKYTDNEFGSEVNEAVMVVSSAWYYTDYQFSAESQNSEWVYSELAYDDGSPDYLPEEFINYIGLGAGHQNYGWANHFKLPDDNEWYPVSLKILCYVNNGNADIHLWSIVNGQPSVDLITPFSVILVSGWNEITLPEDSVSLPQNFFLGVLHNSSESHFSLGIDSTNHTDQTYLVQKLSDGYASAGLATLYDEKYAGYNMMLRAVVRSKNMTGIEEMELTPLVNTFTLTQNYPNPFNPTTNIEFNLPKAVDVKLTVFDMTGRVVQTLVNERRSAGYHRVTWDAAHVASGIYCYRLDAGEFSQVRKMLVIK